MVRRITKGRSRPFHPSPKKIHKIFCVYLHTFKINTFHRNENSHFQSYLTKYQDYGSFRISCFLANDHTYRSGQDKKVFAYRMIFKDTIEEIDSDI